MVSTLKIYEILEQAKIEDKQARAITMAIEQAWEGNNVEQSKVLATKEDVSKLREELKVTIAESKSEMVRWMFIFWLGQIAVLAALFKLLK
ncbi:MAG: hypothetical protein NTV08_14700 [Verrucomicrobia bacterium]|nr:hypothetical protein [Verrucomicrobiota bacterium]